MYKIKPLTKEQILISIDRLTRFKDPEIKYLRVFKDILINNLIIPKYKKNELDIMEYDKLKTIAEHIINYSLEKLNLVVENNYAINKKLQTYENNVFKLSAQNQVLLENKINYKACLSLIDDNSTINLKWLKSLDLNEAPSILREKHSLRFPVEKVVICEGITEEILLPKFAKMCNYDFDKNGVYMLSAGGKNQVVKLFYQLAESLNIPIFVLLDKDAMSNYEEINPRLRKFDNIHILQCGEFEDALPFDLIKKALSYNLKNISVLDACTFNNELGMVKNLEEIFRHRGMHEFKKADFAQIVSENITSTSDISPEIADIIRKIKNTYKI